MGYSRPMTGRTQHRTLLGLVAALTLAGCDGGEPVEGSARSRTADTLRDQLLVVSPNPPQILVSAAAELDRAARFGETARLQKLRQRSGVKRVRADSLAWLTGSAEGRAFLGATAPRAIARGDPAASCPATGLASATDVGREGAVRQALERCLAALGDRRERCGCRLIAVNDILTVPQSEMAYATGIGARLIAPGLGLDAVLVAEDEADGSTLLRDLRGPVARLVREDGERVALTLIGDGTMIAGSRRALGYRRGRLAERVRLDGGGLLLIGLSPGEIAAAAAR